ncbi:uncharacterized protein EI90DRAFT_3047573 [Cantharellus anzutake]|uniref:uncharacterized protein n=1 Tax=Cantharellus anzutake TaxID=1750568 RepID=UPI0019039057|nr:uncharacterized protein EI90DRAFT_3047573 [Cantharellus anzutake]KAF8335927.1 hypothetical protein EI90DRAFT_3047573 [Cantharellus anzutake]
MTVKLDTSMLDASSIAMEDASKKIGDEIALRVWMMTGYRWIYKDCKRGLRGFPGPKRAVQYRYRCSQDRGAQRAPKKVADASKQRARKSKPCFDCKGRLKITIQVVHETWTAKISLEHHISHAPYEFKSSTGSTSPSGDDGSEQDDSMQFHIPSL